MRPSHFVDAQSASKSNQPAGSSGSLYAAARSKATVDRHRLVASATTERLSAVIGNATALRLLQTDHQFCEV